MLKATKDAIKKQILKQTEKVRICCCDNDISKNMAVHEIRKSFKRIKAWLFFYTNIQNGDLIKSEFLLFHDFNKKLGPIRESCVNKAVFKQHFLNTALLPEQKIKTIYKHLSAENQKHLSQLIEGNKIFDGIKSNVFLFEKNIKSKIKDIHD